MRRAYTVTELLVVIAIVVVMAAILFPILGSAKKAAYKGVCASNMHQIYLAAKMYQDDWSAYPDGLTDPAFKSYYPTVLMCPASKNAAFPNLRVVDYTFVGTPSSNVDDKEMDRCRELRGPMLPLVFDDNHIPNETDGHDLASKILVVRESGAYGVVPAGPAYVSKSPCAAPLVPYWYNL